MSNVGPVCHIAPDDVPGRPKASNLPGLPGPVTPNPNNVSQTVNNMAALLNAMRLMLLSLSGQKGIQGNQGASGQNGKNSQTGRWNETGRVTETVRVFQNNDKTSKNWVDVEQINQLNMRDNVTGEAWVWSRDRS